MGKSSLVFDTIVGESQRQMNETYSVWIKGRLPKYEKPQVEYIHHFNPSVVIDHSDTITAQYLRKSINGANNLLHFI